MSDRPYREELGELQDEEAMAYATVGGGQLNRAHSLFTHNTRFRST